MSTILNIRWSLVRNWEPVCSLVRDAFSGVSLPLSPPPCLLPPAGDGPVHCPLALLWNCSVLPLFWNGPAVSSVRAFCQLIFSLSLAILQFKLLSHVSSLRLPSGHSGPVLTLSNAARFSLFSPHLLVVDASVWGIYCWELLLGM